MSANGKSSKAKRSRKAVNGEEESGPRVTNSRQKDVSLRSGLPKNEPRTNKDQLQKRHRVEPDVKEEGEISDSDPEVKYREKKEEKWMEWCAEVMEAETETLKRLERLQTTSVDLPREKVVWLLSLFTLILVNFFWFCLYGIIQHVLSSGSF